MEGREVGKKIPMLTCWEEHNFQSLLPSLGKEGSLNAPVSTHTSASSTRPSLLHCPPLNCNFPAHLQKKVCFQAWSVLLIITQCKYNNLILTNEGLENAI